MSRWLLHDNWLWLLNRRLLYDDRLLLLNWRLRLSLRDRRLATPRNRLDYYWRGTCDNHAQVLGGGLGNVDYPPFDKRPPVVYPNRNLPIVVPVCYDQKRPEGQGGMRRSEQAGIENFPRSGWPSLELGSVPGSDTFLSENLS